MVPVGGAIIAGFDEGFINSISKLYPGEAADNSVLAFPLLTRFHCRRPSKYESNFGFVHNAAIDGPRGLAWPFAATTGKTLMERGLFRNPQTSIPTHTAPQLLFCHP